jgi:hypothetical protein
MSAYYIVQSGKSLSILRKQKILVKFLSGISIRGAPCRRGVVSVPLATGLFPPGRQTAPAAETRPLRPAAAASVQHG